MSNGQPPMRMAAPQPPQSNYIVQQTQLPQTSYTIQNPPKAERNIRPIPGIKYFSVATMTMAFLMCILGVIAIVIEAKDSYVGNPIWSGVLFLLPTGLLGLTSYLKKKSFCSNISYLLLCIITCVVCFQLLVYSCINAVREWSYCDPSPGYYDYWNYYHYDYDDQCQFDRGGRIAVDSLIAVLAFAQMVLCIISLSLTCYGTFDCCYYCCRSTPPAVVQYRAQNGACQLVSVGGYQSPTAYQPVSLMVPVGQTGQMMSPGAPVMANPQMQFIPASPAQIAVVPQPHGNFPAANHTPTANGATPTGNKPLPPSENDQQPQRQEAPLSYGHTASDQFHDEKTLLETA